MQFMSRHQRQYDGEPSYDSGQYGKDYGEEYKPPGLYLSAGPEAAHRFNEGTLTTHRGVGFRGQFFVCQVPPRSAIESWQQALLATSPCDPNV